MNPKYKAGDRMWRTADAMKLWPSKPQEAYDVVIVTPFFDNDVSEHVHYVLKVFTHIDNYFDTIEERFLFATKEEAEKDSERRYHAHKRSMSELKKSVDEFTEKYRKGETK